LNTNFLVFSSLKKYDQSFQSKKFSNLTFDDSIILWTKALKLFVLKISKVWDVAKAHLKLLNRRNCEYEGKETPK
jgi:hypothetical protein